jgi:hypothetical protein
MRVLSKGKHRQWKEGREEWGTASHLVNYFSFYWNMLPRKSMGVSLLSPDALNDRIESEWMERELRG